MGAFVLWPPRSHERINIHLAKSSHCEMLVLWQLASSSTLPFCSPTPLSAHIKHNHNIQPPSCQKLGWALSGYLGSGHELQVVIDRVSRHCQGTSSSGCFRCGYPGYPDYPGSGVAIVGNAGARPALVSALQLCPTNTISPSLCRT